MKNNIAIFIVIGIVVVAAGFGLFFVMRQGNGDDPVVDKTGVSTPDDRTAPSFVCDPAVYPGAELVGRTSSTAQFGLLGEEFYYASDDPADAIGAFYGGEYPNLTEEKSVGLYSLINEPALETGVSVMEGIGDYEHISEDAFERRMQEMAREIKGREPFVILSVVVMQSEAFPGLRDQFNYAGSLDGKSIIQIMCL